MGRATGNGAGWVPQASMLADVLLNGMAPNLVSWVGLDVGVGIRVLARARACYRHTRGCYRTSVIETY